MSNGQRAEACDVASEEVKDLIQGEKPLIHFKVVFTVA